MASKYSVGYGKPPKHSQFQPGQSGNPKGRPKGLTNLKTDLTEELGESILIREGEHRRRVSKQRAMVKSLFVRAANGDTRALRLAFDLTSRLIGAEQELEVPDQLSAEEEEVLAQYLARQKAKTEPTPVRQRKRQRKD
nr:DUF5681 domain-containing protein [Nitrosomonas nitrosa]